MTVYYVDKSGDDSNAGTDPRNPKLTIANACSVADNGAGNTVEIRDSGQYDEGDIYIYANPITIKATGSNKPILDGDPNNNDYVFRPYISGCIVQGLIMRNYDNGLVAGAAAIGYNYIISGCMGQVETGPMLIGNTGGQTEIRDSLILVDNGACFQPYSTGPTAKVLFVNSVFSSNMNSGASYGNTINFSQVSTNTTMSFCTVIGLGAGGGRNYNAINQIAKVINCIITGSGDGINAHSSTYNLVNVSGDPFVVWSADSYDGTPRSANTGEITGAPVFNDGGALGSIDFDTQNYNLRAESPAIDAGTPYLDITHDISGNLRTDPDIGPYEFEAEDPPWATYTSQPKSKWGSDLSINTLANYSSNYKYDYDNNIGQAPFSTANKNPSSIRNRRIPYKTFKS